MPYAYDLSRDFDSDRYVSWALTDAGEGVFAPLIDSNPGGYHLIGHGEIGSADDYLVVPISLYSGQSLVLDIITGFGGFDPAAVEIAVVDALGNSIQEFDWTGATTSSAFSAPSSGLYYVVVHDQSGDYTSNFNVFPGNGETGELLLDLSTQPIEFLDRRVGTQDDDTEDASGLPFNVNFDGRGGQRHVLRAELVVVGRWRGRRRPPRRRHRDRPVLRRRGPRPAGGQRRRRRAGRRAG